ncbi:MAG: hypothetical protein NTX44_00585 [Ignavibacteriales bacterium]|nr:hypothetical protein [Ignavibacteriales bacterium]
MPNITADALSSLRNEFDPLIGLKVDWLSLPEDALPGFEPSQIAVIVNTILDAALPQISLLATTTENKTKLLQIGLTKSPNQIGEREEYPDYIHKSGYRVELKGLFVDNEAIKFKRPPTRREPSARLKENVTVKEVDQTKDVLMLLAVQLQEFSGICHPVIIDIGLFPVMKCIQARDKRLKDAGGKWFNGIPKVVKKDRMKKYRAGKKLTNADYEKDTNFGKLKRIPYKPLQAFMRKHGALGDDNE